MIVFVFVCLLCFWFKCFFCLCVCCVDSVRVCVVLCVLIALLCCCVFVVCVFALGTLVLLGALSKKGRVKHKAHHQTTTPPKSAYKGTHTTTRNKQQ